MISAVGAEIANSPKRAEEIAQGIKRALDVLSPNIGDSASSPCNTPPRWQLAAPVHPATVLMTPAVPCTTSARRATALAVAETRSRWTARVYVPRKL